MAAAHYVEGLCAVVIACLGIANLRAWMVARYRVSRGGRVLGQVVGAKVKRGITGPPSYTFWEARHAIVRYIGQHGQSYTTLAGRDLPVGTQVALVSNPRHPDRAEEQCTDAELHAGAICTAAALGLILVMLVT
jgi:hypothetical protein